MAPHLAVIGMLITELERGFKFFKSFYFIFFLNIVYVRQ